MKLVGAWWAYSASESDDNIRHSFHTRFGYGPDWIVRSGPVKLAGPIYGSAPVEIGRKTVTGEVVIGANYHENR